jgi:predicted metal-dependent HD superfamily phosphohydrolase
MITDTFLKLVKKYSNNNELANNLWLEIFTKYSDAKRQYHTIDHLEAMISILNEVKKSIEDWDTTLFALFYHDVIYKASSSSNEADSAKLAMERLSTIAYPANKIAKCANMILATKQHLTSEDNDTNFLLDADLAILGTNEEDYQKYKDQIREEYSVYPDFMYNAGRRKTMQQFLNRDTIYKTAYFINKFNQQAKNNIERELLELA